MLHATIMAGGAGTRFWPASRQDQPKQLLPLAGSRSMIQATVDRLQGLCRPEDLLIVTNARLVDAIADQLPEIPRACIVGEPAKRDTAPCVGLAAALVSARDPEATMVVMPADHVIGPDEVFRDALRQAAARVEEDPQRIVTFGIQPSYPAEVFGYIQRQDPPLDQAAPATYRVERFREKPDANTARAFVEAGTFYWNSGIFVWKARTILEALRRWAPDIARRIDTIAGAVGQPDYAEVLQREFTAIEGTSIDYAVMENHQPILVMEAPFSWDDLGNWTALPRLLGTDEQGNCITGQHLGIQTRGTIVRTGDNHLVVTVGMEDCIVVHTPDATLIANRQHEAAIKQVVEQLQERGWDKYL